MEIDREEVRRVALLAHLELDEAALERMAAEMSRILSYIDQLAEVDVEGFDEHGPIERMPMREDEPRPSIAREPVERNAPAWRDGCFVVPKVIGGE